MTIGRIIETDACVAEGAAWLAAQEPRFARALTATGPLPLRRRPDGFAPTAQRHCQPTGQRGLGRAIWAKIETAGVTTPQAVLTAGEDDLRALGLSRQKASYALALAEAGIDFDALRHLPDADVVRILTAVKGIGVWTAEIYAMFSLGRADVFAPGDLALQEGARSLFELPERPKERALRQMALDWSPWQSVAARILWAWYHVEKQREGIA